MSVDLGSAHGSIILDNSQVLRSAREASAALREFEQRTASSSQGLARLGDATPVQKLRGDMTDLSGVVGALSSRFAVAAVALRALDFSRDAIIDYNAAIQQTEIRLTAVTGSQSQAANALALARREADAGRGTFLELSKAVGDLVPVSRQSGASLEQLVRTAQLLATVNPAEGLTGAVFSLREFLSSGGTDLVSLAERFNLSRAAIRQFKQQGASDLEAVQKSLAAMGFTFDLVSKQAETFNSQSKIVQARLTDLAAIAGKPLFQGAADSLKELNLALASNEAKESAAAIAEALKLIGTSVSDFFGDLQETNLKGQKFFSDLGTNVLQSLADIPNERAQDDPVEQWLRRTIENRKKAADEVQQEFDKHVKARAEGTKIPVPGVDQAGVTRAEQQAREASGRILGAYLSVFSGADLGQVESLSGVISGLLGQGQEGRGLELAARIVADLGQSNQLTAETTQALTQALGNQSAQVLALVAAYGRLGNQQTALRAAQESIKAAQATLADVQAQREQALAPLQTAVEAAQTVAQAHAEQAQSRIGAMRDEMAGVQREAEDAGRAWDTVLRAMNADLKALQETARGNAAAFQSQIDAAQGQLARIQRQVEANARAFQQQVETEQAGLQALQRQAEANAAASRATLEAARGEVEAARTAAQQHAGVVQAILRGETQEWVNQQAAIDDTTRGIIRRYGAEVRGLINARNAARDEVDEIEAARTARLLSIDEQIAAARAAGNRTEVRRLARTRQRAETGTPAEQDAERVARGRAALADRELTQAERRIQAETAGIRAVDTERQKAADANLTAVQAAADAQAAADKAAIDAQQQRIQGIQQAAKTQADADRAAIEAQQEEIARIQAAAKLQADADQAAIAAQQTRIDGVQEQQRVERERYDARIRQMQDELAREERRAAVEAKADAASLQIAQERLAAAERYWAGEIDTAQKRLDYAQKWLAIAQQDLDIQERITRDLERRIAILEDAIRRGIITPPGQQTGPQPGGPTGQDTNPPGSGGGGGFQQPTPSPPPPPIGGPTAFNRFAPSLSAFQQPAMALAPPAPVTVTVPVTINGAVVDNEARLRQLSAQIAADAEERVVGGLLDAWDERGRGGFVYGRPV